MEIKSDCSTEVEENDSDESIVAELKLLCGEKMDSKEKLRT